MKILQVNCVYREGSTGKIVASIGDSLRTLNHTIFTCYGLGKDNIDGYSKKICTDFEHKTNALFSRITGIPFGGIYISNVRIRKTVRDFKPDVVHLHCVNGSTLNVYKLLKFLAKSGIKTILTLHAEIFHTAGCEHAFECDKWKDGCHDCALYKQRVHSWFFDRSKSSYKKMYEAINSFSQKNLIVTAVSPWLAERAKQSAILKQYDVVYVPNGVDISIFNYKKSIGLIKKEKFEKVLLFVTPYFGLEETDIKGCRYLIKIATELHNYKFIVVSSRTSNNIGILPDNIQLWGRAKNQNELAQLYSEADLTLLLSSRETYSMVTVESLCCGTQVVGFRAGGPESIALKEYTNFVEHGNVTSLIKQIISTAPCDSKIISNIAIKTYSQNVMASMFYNLYLSKK